jgi:phosphatidylglycerophosphate synthase
MTTPFEALPELLDESAAQPLYHAELANQRPDDVLGEWELVAPEDRNIHQKVAAATAGWVTLPNVITLVGAEITRRGIKNAAEGFRERSVKKVALGAGQIGVGRCFDLWDGKEAKKRGVRGKPGALLDATVDKGLVGYAGVKLAKEDIIPVETAVATLAQQGIITAQSLAIETLGGEPNPTKSGKLGMFSVWSNFSGRIVGKVAAMVGMHKTAKVVEIAARGAEAASYALNGHASLSYGKKLIDTVRNRFSKK